ncbi:MAG TPA: hypothetical protein VID73_11240, partial [Ktedonobacterales bacterium]
MPRDPAMQAVERLDAPDGQAPSPQPATFGARQHMGMTLRAAWHDAARPLALVALAVAALPGYVALAALAHSDGSTPPPTGPVALLLALLLPYGAACWLVLARPAPRARLWRRVEWGALVAGALAFRVVL